MIPITLSNTRTNKARSVSSSIKFIDYASSCIFYRVNEKTERSLLNFTAFGGICSVSKWRSKDVVSK